MGQTPASSPAPTPAKAIWPMPSPISDILFWTRKVPIMGAKTPTATLAISARCMNDSSKGYGNARARTPNISETLQPLRQVLAVHAQVHTFGHQLRGRPVEQHAVLEDDDAVQVLGHRRELVRDEQDAGAVVGHQVGERIAELLLRARVDTRDRLVEHQQIRFAGEGSRDEHTLLLPTRQLVDRSLREVAQTHGVHRVADSGPILA